MPQHRGQIMSNLSIAERASLRASFFAAWHARGTATPEWSVRPHDL
jgi:hypothetical protein